MFHQQQPELLVSVNDVGFPESVGSGWNELQVSFFFFLRHGPPPKPPLFPTPPPSRSGGATTEVSGQTADLLFEAAHWDPVTVARTARRHKLPSEASKRFERGVDPQLTPVAVARAAARSEEHTSELQSQSNLVCRLLLE